MADQHRFQRQYSLNVTAITVLCRWYEIWERYRQHPARELRYGALNAKLTGLICHDRIANDTHRRRLI